MTIFIADDDAMEGVFQENETGPSPARQARPEGDAELEDDEDDSIFGAAAGRGMFVTSGQTDSAQLGFLFHAVLDNLSE